MIEGMIQGIKYGSAAHRLFFHLRRDGLDATPKGDAKASLDFGAQGLTKLDTVIEFYQSGAHGNGWTVQTAAGAALAITVDNDEKTVLITFVSATTTVTQVETAIGALTGTDARITVKTAGTGANVLTSGGDTLAATSLSGGTYVEPTITIYDTAGTAILDATDLTQSGTDGTSPIWYYDLDASDTTAFDKGYGYRAHIQWYDFTDTSLLIEDHLLLDVCVWPFNEPLVTTEEIDTMHPNWAGKKPGSWTDWTEAIERAHLALARELREMRDNKEEHIYPNRILDRGQLRQVEIAYVEREIALAIRLRDEEKNEYLEKAANAMPTELWIDRDDDLTPDDDEEGTAGITFIR